MEKWLVGVDLGGTKIEVVASTLEGEIFHLKKFPTPKDFQIAVKEISSLVQEFSREFSSSPLGIGIGIAGQVSREGVLSFAPNLNWVQLPLASLIQEATGISTRILNDVKAAIYAEWQLGAGRKDQNLVGVWLGTGIGGGVITEGILLEGADGCASEIGHFIVDYNGPKCSCGGNGCLEAIAGGAALTRKAMEIFQGQNVHAGTLLEAWRNHHEEASKIVEQAYCALSAGFLTIIHAYNPEKIILGGGLTKVWPELLPFLNQVVLEKALPAARNCRIVLGEKEHAVALGAALSSV